MSEIDKIIVNVDSSMAMEDMPLTQEDIDRIRICLSNPDIMDELLAELLQKHTVISEM